MEPMKAVLMKDFMAASAIMASPHDLTLRLHHNELEKPLISRRMGVVVKEAKDRSLIVDDKTFEEKGIQLCIQNEDKFAVLTSHITRTDIRVYVSTTFVTFIVRKPNKPLTIMRFPLDGSRVYGIPGFIATIPGGQIEFDSKCARYAFYFVKRNVEGRDVLTVHYDTGSDFKSSYEIRTTTTMDHINADLQPKESSATLLMEARLQDNSRFLDNITPLMISPVDILDSFKNPIKGTNTLEVVPSDDSNEQELVLRSETALSKEGRVMSRTDRSILWRMSAGSSYSMIDREILPFQGANQKFRTASDSLYIVFGSFGDTYVFAKLISTHAITSIDSSRSQTLSEIIGGVLHILELYFCKVR